MQDTVRDNDEDHRKPAAVEDDDDEDDDDWSRQVETDETVTGALHDDSSVRMESVQEEEVGNEVVPRPKHPELSLKERLVLRERQRRIETERARLKRQFALNNGGDRDGDDGGNNRETEGSVAEGTLGEESTIAHPDDESNDQEKLGFNMERFLRNSDSFDPQLQPATDSHNSTLMERFLNDPVIPQVDPQVEQVESSRASEVQRTVSFDVERIQNEEAEARTGQGYASSLEEAMNLSVGTNSVQVEVDDDEAERDPLTSATSIEAHGSVTGSDARSSTTPVTADEPRVLRLTEADMQEMAAIEVRKVSGFVWQ
jgi:hypothetical protein